MENYFEPAIQHFAAAVERFKIPGKHDPHVENMVKGLHLLALAIKQESEVNAKRFAELERRLPAVS